jgi:transposase
MDMSTSFKSAVQSALGKPVIVADRFHFCRYIYWALDRVRKRIEQSFHDFDRKTCKRIRHIFHKENTKLTDEQSKKVEDSNIPEMMDAIKTFRNWQTEILNSFAYDYSNGSLEGINYTTKVLKRNAYVYRNFKRFRAKILLNKQYKGIGLHIG